jgi:thioredoxin reductase
VYNLIEPEQYAGKRVLVVGGGDSALEAATSIAEVSASVALSYRGEAFARAKPRNRDRVESARRAGRLDVLLASQVRRIEPDAVVLEQGEHIRHLANEHVIVSAGGIMPTDFLRTMGIHVETKFGTA